MSAIEMDVSPRRRFYTFAAPISAQNLIGISLLIVDMAMISRLGFTAVTAIGVIRGLFFFFQIVSDSICQHAGAAIARFSGAGDWPSIWRTATTVLVLNICVATPFTLAALFLHDEVAELLVGSENAEVAAAVASYLHITAPFFVLNAVILAFSALVRSTGRPKLPLYAAVVALTLNTTLNYVLIFGIAGFAGLGLEGAAIATVISRVVEALILATCIIALMKPKLADLAFRFSTMLSILKNAYPVFLKSLIWSSGMFAYGLVFLRSDPEGYASYAVLLAVDSLLFAVIYGFVVTTKIFVGNEIGAGRSASAYESASDFIQYTMLVVCGVGVLALMAIPVFWEIFAISSAERLTFTIVFVAIVVRALFRSVTASIMDGVMRAGNDNLHAAYIEVIANYLVNLPLLIGLAYFFGFSIEVLVFIALSDELVRLVMASRRLKSKKWLATVSMHKKSGTEG